MQAEPRERFLESQVAYTSTMLHLTESYAKELEGILTEVVGGVEVATVELPEAREVEPAASPEPKAPMQRASVPTRGTRSTRTPARSSRKDEHKFDMRTKEGREAAERYKKRVESAAKAREAKAKKAAEAQKLTI